MSKELPYEKIVQMCKGCKYFRSLTDIKTSRRYCNYLLDTGEPRGSPPQECTHKKIAPPVGTDGAEKPHKF